MCYAKVKQKLYDNKKYNNLCIGSWNINGFNIDEINDLYNRIKIFDITFLSETWVHFEGAECDESSVISFPNMYSYSKCRKKNPQARRGLRGLIFICKSELKASISIVENKYDDILWVKI